MGHCNISLLSERIVDFTTHPKGGGVLLFLPPYFLFVKHTRNYFPHEGGKCIVRCPSRTQWMQNVNVYVSLRHMCWGHMTHLVTKSFLNFHLVCVFGFTVIFAFQQHYKPVWCFGHLVFFCKVFNGAIFCSWAVKGNPNEAIRYPQSSSNLCTVLNWMSAFVI